MASDPEALTQLSRLVGEPISPDAAPAEVQRVLEQHLTQLAEGIVAEAASSDDVSDHDSAVEFVEARLDELAKWLTESQRSRLLETARDKIVSW